MEVGLSNPFRQISAEPSSSSSNLYPKQCAQNSCHTILDTRSPGTLCAECQARAHVRARARQSSVNSKNKQVARTMDEYARLAAPIRGAAELNAEIRRIQVSFRS